MIAYTPLQTLAKIHRQLWWLIRLTGSVEVQLGSKSESFEDLCQVEKVLRVSVEEVGKIIQREREKTSDHRNIRLAEDFALKAKVAKARDAVTYAVKLVNDEQSHK